MKTSTKYYSLYDQRQNCFRDFCFYNLRINDVFSFLFKYLNLEEFSHQLAYKKKTEQALGLNINSIPSTAVFCLFFLSVREQ